MRRLFYLAAGAAIGVASMRRITRAARAYTPEALGGRAVDLGEAVRGFAADVRAGMSERENDLRQALKLDEEQRDDVRD